MSDAPHLPVPDEPTEDPLAREEHERAVDPRDNTDPASRVPGTEPPEDPSDVSRD